MPGRPCGLLGPETCLSGREARKYGYRGAIAALLVTRASRTWSMCRRASLGLAMTIPVLVSIPTSGCGGLRLVLQLQNKGG